MESGRRAGPRSFWVRGPGWGRSVPHHHDEKMRAPPSTFAFPVDFGTVIYSTEPQQIERGGTAQNFWGTTDFIWGRESFRRLEFPLDHL